MYNCLRLFPHLGQQLNSGNRKYDDKDCVKNTFHWSFFVVEVCLVGFCFLEEVSLHKNDDLVFNQFLKWMWKNLQKTVNLFIFTKEFLEKEFFCFSAVYIFYLIFCLFLIRRVNFV